MALAWLCCTCGIPERDDTVVTLHCLEDQYPVVAVTVNGTPRRMLIDTGVPATTISSTLLNTPNNLWAHADLIFGNTLLVKHALVWAQDTPFSSPDADSINGIIGLDVLTFVRPTFDHMRSVTLNTPYQSQHRCALYPFTKDPHGRPRLAKVTVDEVVLTDILLDTGAKYCVVNGATVKHLGAYLREQAVPTSITTIAGHQPTGAWLSPVHRYCVMQTCEEHIMVHFPKWNVIGDSFLARFRVTLDFGANTLALCPE